MKKTLLVLPILLLLLLAACGEETTPETTAPPPIEVEIPYEEPVETLPYQDIELTLGATWYQEDPRAQVLLQAAQLFEKKTGAVVTVLWPEENWETLDILQISAVDFAEMDPEEALDLTLMAHAAGYDEKSHEVLRQQIVDHCGYLGAVAQVPYLGGVYYNADVFESCGIAQMPGTWEDFLDVCQTLRDSGWKPLTLDKEDAVTAMELHLRRTIGSEQMVQLMGKNAHWHYDQAAIGAMEQVMLFVQEGNMTFGTPADYPSGQNKMALSNSAMMIGTNADCADIEEETLIDLNWGVFPYPGELESGTWISADVLVIDKACPNAQAAFDFVMLLATGEFDQLLADVSCGIPADPNNASPIAGALEALRDAPPAPLGIFGKKQTDTAVKLWSGWYEKASRYAVALERSK